MSLQDSLFAEDVEDDVTTFARDETRKRALVFPPVNNYRRFIIHQLIQERFSDLLRTFSIGQGSARRTVVCFKSDLKSDWAPTPNAPERRTSPATRQSNTTAREMGVEGRRSSSTSPEHTQLQRQAKSTPTIEIYRPPAARKAGNCSQTSGTQTKSTADSTSVKNARQRRPDRAVYVPRHRRSLETAEEVSRNMKVSHANPRTTLNEDPNTNNNSKLQDACCIRENTDSLNLHDKTSESRMVVKVPLEVSQNVVTLENVEEVSGHKTNFNVERRLSKEPEEDIPVLAKQNETVIISITSENITNSDLKLPDKVELDDKRIETPQPSVELDNKQVETSQPSVEENEPVVEKYLNSNDVIDRESTQSVEQSVASKSLVSDILIISDTTKKKVKHSEQVPEILTSPEKRVKKIERQKSKPAPPPSPPQKLSRDECDWDRLYDDNGDCLDPTLIEELTSAVDEVTIEQPKNNYKAYSKQIEVSSDEFAHVVEIYNFPSEFKTSDLATVFSPWSGKFEFKWIDDTHCLGVFTSPLVAAEVLASDHPFVKTRPLSEASALSKTKVRRSTECLQPYRNRPKTCVALANRLVSKALGMTFPAARQEREHEKNVLRKAKEERRLANKQREDAWKGIIPEK